MALFERLKKLFLGKGPRALSPSDSQMHVSQSPLDSLEAYMERGSMHFQKDDFQAALDDFDKAVDLSKALEQQSQYAVALAERGLAYAELGNHSEAMADYNKAIEIDPAYAIVYLYKGLLHAMQERWADALKNLDESIRLGPIPEAYFDRAAVYEILGEYQLAIDDLRMFLKYAEDQSTEGVRRRVKHLEEKLKLLA